MQTTIFREKEAHETRDTTEIQKGTTGSDGKKPAQPDQRLDWGLLEKKYEKEKKLVAAMRGLYEGGPLELRAGYLAGLVNVNEKKATDILEEMERAGFLATKRMYVCPSNGHNALLDDDQARQEVCAICGRAFSDDDGMPAPVTVFVSSVPTPRLVSWMLVLHGMSSTGRWQEQFNWLISLMYGQSVPVAIYKYGIIRAGAVLKFKQRALHSNWPRKSVV